MTGSLDETALYLFHQGTNTHAYEMLGVHAEGDAHRFSVWAPNARAVAVVGDGNGWEPTPMERLESGVWAAKVKGFSSGMFYKYAVTEASGETSLRADPYAVCCEARPKNASVVYDLDGYAWGDGVWMKQRKAPYNCPMSIYEVHPGSWKGAMNLRRLAHEMIPYVCDMGYTHIEMMPIAHHPLKASWGYQVTGYYCVDAELGTPHDLMYFVDQCHQAGLGVILDWVSAHFPRDSFALGRFDGTPLYEHPDPRRGELPEWGTYQFNYKRNEVQSFLYSNALFWMREYHFDGLRADAVSALLYRDYGRKPGQWTLNEHGGRENTSGIAFCHNLSRYFFGEFPGGLLIAEESSVYPMVTKPVHDGGLGFNFKWNMGWMNDILSYMELDWMHRRHHHGKLTFSMCYAFSENYILALSHDEVVHGKKSLLSKMTGDYWQQFASLRLLFGYMFAHPGKKLMFMGGEFGQYTEWCCERPLDWNLLEYESHEKMRRTVKALNHIYSGTPALYEVDGSQDGFDWLSASDHEHSIIAFARYGSKETGDTVVCVFNFTPNVHERYRIGVSGPGAYQEVFNSDDEAFGGSGVRNARFITSEPEPCSGCAHSLEIRVPPLAALYLRKQ